MSESLGFLGLARSAGKVAAGEDAVAAALQTGKVRLLLLASDAGDKTVRRTEHQSGGKLPIIYLDSDKEAFGAALGWNRCAVAALTDLGMALALAKKMAEQNPRHQTAVEALEETSARIAARKVRKPRKHGGNRK